MITQLGKPQLFVTLSTVSPGLPGGPITTFGHSTTFFVKKTFFE